MSIEDNDLARLLATIEDFLKRRVEWDEELAARCVNRARSKIREGSPVLPQEPGNEAEVARWLQDFVEEVVADELALLLSSDLDHSLDRLFFAYEPEIRSSLANKLHNETDVDVCVFRTFENVWNALRNKSPKEIRELRHIRRFCQRAAQTVFWKFIREQDKRRHAEESFEELAHMEETFLVHTKGLEEEMLREETAQEMRNCLDLLPEGYRGPLRLHYLEDLKSPEIAQLLDWPGKEGAVRVRVQIDRGRDWLRKYLEIKRIFEQPANVQEREDIQEYVRALSSFTEAVLRFHFMDHCNIASMKASLIWTEEDIRSCLFGAVKRLHNYVEVKQALTADAPLDLLVLSESDRLVVRAYFFEHRPLERIALESHLKEKQVIASLQRGVRILHQQLLTSTKRAIESKNEGRE